MDKGIYGYVNRFRYICRALNIYIYMYSNIKYIEAFIDMSIKEIQLRILK